MQCVCKMIGRMSLVVGSVYVNDTMPKFNLISHLLPRMTNIATANVHIDHAHLIHKAEHVVIRHHGSSDDGISHINTPSIDLRNTTVCTKTIQQCRSLAIRHHGLTVTVDHLTSLMSLTIVNSPIETHLTLFTSLTKLEIWIRDGRQLVIPPLTNLRSLCTDAPVQQLHTLTNLTELDVKHINDNTIKALSSLTSLGLRKDIDVNVLNSLPLVYLSLYVDMYSSRLRLPKLRSLVIGTRAHMTQIYNLTHLRELYIKNPIYGDPTIESLTGLTSLESLTLANNRHITDMSLSLLTSLWALKIINVAMGTNYCLTNLTNLRILTTNQKDNVKVADSCAVVFANY